jgi:transposase-like protein
MKRNCPKDTCKSDQIIKNGFFHRKNDSRKIQRFKCKKCGTKFSSSTGTLEFGQKKRRVNFLLLKLFCAKVTQRRAARIAGVNKVTVARKFDYLSKKAALKNERFKRKLANDKSVHIQFDDLITKEKTKLKPLSVTVVVDAQRRFILEADVSQIASFGHLAKISKRKYGPRRSFHKESLEKIFINLTDVVDQSSLIQSDEHSNYNPVVRKYFPEANYKQYKSERGCVAGQGELKKTNFDHIFTINHTLAVMRDSLGTLVRRTWCTTQDPRRLKGHLEMFIYYYNQIYLGGLSPG